jgi:hypothetical protein
MSANIPTITAQTNAYIADFTENCGTLISKKLKISAVHCDDFTLLNFDLNQTDEDKKPAIQFAQSKEEALALAGIHLIRAQEPLAQKEIAGTVISASGSAYVIIKSNNPRQWQKSQAIGDTTAFLHNAPSKKIFDHLWYKG